MNELDIEFELKFKIDRKDLFVQLLQITIVFKAIFFAG